MKGYPILLIWFFNIQTQTAHLSTECKQQIKNKIFTQHNKRNPSLINVKQVSAD